MIAITIVMISMMIAMLPYLGVNMVRQRRTNNNNSDNNNNNSDNSDVDGDNVVSDALECSLPLSHDSYYNSSKVCLRFFGFIVAIIGLFAWLIWTRSSLITSSSSSVTIQNKDCIAPTGFQLIGAYGGVRVESNGNLSIPDINMYKMMIDTDDMGARLLFIQGMIQLYGFNREEARRNFESCQLLDPNCIFCVWGMSMAYGPNLNAGMSDDDIAKGKAESLRGLEMIEHCHGLNVTRCENFAVLYTKLKDLLSTTLVRFTSSIEFSNKMMILADKYPTDDDIVALYAESVLMLTPWAYFNPQHRSTNFTYLPESGKLLNRQDEFISFIDQASRLKPEIKSAVIRLRDVLLRNEFHPLALHLYIHITEQSDHPAFGLKSADKLRQVAVLLGSNHLSHMPAHAYLRSGHFGEAIESSVRAISQHKQYEDNCLTPYVPLHDQALLVSAAMYSGQIGLALKYAKASALGANSSEDHLETPAMHPVSHRYVAGLVPTPRELVFARFGEWSAIRDLHRRSIWSNINHVSEITRAQIGDLSTYLVAIHIYTDILSQLGLSDLHNADVAQAALLEMSLQTQRVESTKSVFTVDHVFYPYHREMAWIMNLTAHAAAARIQSRGAAPQGLRAGLLVNAVSLLREAVSVQDSFSYMEPENYYMPMRECYGLANLELASDLLGHSELKNCRGISEAIRYANESATAFLFDLQLGQHPFNPRSIFGLRIVLEWISVASVLSDKYCHDQIDSSSTNQNVYSYDHLAILAGIIDRTKSLVLTWPTNKSSSLSHIAESRSNKLMSLFLRGLEIVQPSRRRLRSSESVELNSSNNTPSRSIHDLLIQIRIASSHLVDKIDKMLPTIWMSQSDPIPLCCELGYCNAL